jgi:hypothetical protein
MKRGGRGRGRKRRKEEVLAGGGEVRGRDREGRVHAKQWEREREGRVCAGQNTQCVELLTSTLGFHTVTITASSAAQSILLQ